MGAVGVLLVRRARRDVGADDDQARAVGDVAGADHGGLEGVEVEVLVEVLDVPAVGLVARAHVLGEGEIRVALDRDVVVVVEADELAETEVAGERGGLAGDALLHVAVRGDEVGEVADGGVVGPVEAGREHALAEREADRGGDPLAERAGRRLDARDVAVLRVAGTRRAELAELLDLVERDVVAGEVERRVEQHRRVAAGEDEAVAPRPVRRLRGMAHDARVQHVGDRRERHRGAGMTRVGLLDGVHRQGADGVHAQLVQRALVGPDRHSAPRVRRRCRVNLSQPRGPLRPAVTGRRGGASRAARQRRPARISPPMCSASRMASATMVSVGLAAAPLVKALPSPTYTFGTSWQAPWRGTTPASGRPLLRAVPMLWVEGYGVVRCEPVAPTA